MNSFKLILLCCCNYLCAQQIPFPVQVSVYNSKFKTGKTIYVTDAEITTPGSKPAVITNNTKGLYLLNVVSKKNGESIQLEVESPTYEVVTTNDLKDATLGRIDPLQIFMASPGALVQAKLEFLQINRDKLTATRDKQIKTLKANNNESKKIIAELQSSTKEIIENNKQAERILNEKMLQLQENLPEVVKRLVEQNLDYANESYQSAYKQLEKGNVEQAIKILNPDKAFLSAQSSLAAIEKAKKGIELNQQIITTGQLSFDQNINQLYLAADTENLRFRFHAATVILEKIVLLLEKAGTNPKKMAIAYSYITENYKQAGRPDKALAIDLKAMSLLEKEIPRDSGMEAIFHNNIGAEYIALNDSENALKHLLISIGYLENNINEENQTLLAIAYSQIALCYINTGEMDKALNNLQKAESIQKTKSLSKNLATTYNTFAIYYYKLGQYSEAINYELLCIDIEKKLLNDTHPQLATSYNNLGIYFFKMGKTKEGLEILKKSISIREVIDPNYFVLAGSYTTLGNYYLLSGEFQQALEYYLKAQKVYKNNSNLDNQVMALFYYNLAKIYYNLEKNENAIEYLLQSIKILESDAISKGSDLRENYDFIAEIYGEIGESTKAMEYLKKAIDCKRN